MSDQFCTQCGARLESPARFCTACGTAVSAPPPLPTSPRQRPDTKTFPWPLALLMVGVFLIVAGAGFSFLSSRSNNEIDVPDEHDAAGLPYPEIPRISVEDTKERLDSGTAVVVDVRSLEEYAEAHITNAISIPLDLLQARRGELATDTEIITYCT